MWLEARLGLVMMLMLGTIHAAVEHTDEHESEDTRFLVITLVERIFIELEDSIAHVTNSITTVFNHINIVFKVTVNVIATLIDIVIRQPANYINKVLNAIIWTVNVLVYILLDFCMHSVLKRCVLFLAWASTSLINFLIGILSTGILECLHLLRTIVLCYLNSATILLVYVVYPCLETVFWSMSVFIITVLGMWTIHVMKERIHIIQQTIKEHLTTCIFIFIVSLYATFDIMRIVCQLILKFICYPIITCVYVICVGYVTYLIIVSVSDKCIQLRFPISRILHLRFTLLNKISARLCKRHETETVKHWQPNDNECIVCYEEKSRVTLLPCQHTNICMECTVRVLQVDDRCPMCRTPIQHYTYIRK